MSDEKKVLIDVDIKATEAERNSPRGRELQKSPPARRRRKRLLQSHLLSVSFFKVSYDTSHFAG